MKIIRYILILLLIASNAFALDIIPNAKGYGVDTTAGSGRSEEPWSTTIRIVDSLADDGSGGTTFREAIVAHNAASTPSVILFEVSGTIVLGSSINITKPHLTIAGQTAPSPGIELMNSSTNTGITLQVYADDVLIQHIRSRPGDDYCTGSTYDNVDAFSILGGSEAVNNVIVDHCSFAWSTDEVVSIWGAEGQQMTNVTIRNCIIGPALNDSCHADPPGGAASPHGLGLIVGQHPSVTTGATNILFDRNLFNRNEGRNPLVRSEELLMTNNLIYGWWSGASQIHGQDPGFASLPQFLSVVGNSYIAESYTGTYPFAYPIQNEGIGDEEVYESCMSEGSEVYVYDILCPNYGACTSFRFGTDPYVGVDPITWPTGLAAQLLDSADVEDEVLLNVGARPLDRDTVDTDIITAATNKTGTIINCVEKDTGNAACDEVGEYAYITRPPLAENTNDPLISTLIPASPNDEYGSSGYTNLEVFLFGYSAALEPALIYGVSPGDGGKGISITASATWDYGSDVDDVDVYLDKGTCAAEAKTTLVSDDDADKTYDMSTLDETSIYCLVIVANYGALQGVDQEFEFTTTTGPPAPPAGLSTISYHPLGLTGVYDDQGATVGE